MQFIFDLINKLDLQEIILSIFDNIIWVLLSIVAFVIWNRMVYLKAVSDNLVSKMNASSKSELKRNLKSFCKMRFISRGNSDSKTFTSSYLIRNVKKVSSKLPKVWIIVADGGMGKSSFLENLAFKALNKKIPKVSTMSSRGVFYYKFSSKESLKSLFNEIDDDLSNSSSNKKILVLDSFDESRENAINSPEKVFKDLRLRIQDRYYSKFTRIIISTRKDIFKNGYTTIRSNSYNQFESKSFPLILEVKALNFFDMLIRYMRIGGSIRSNDRNNPQKHELLVKKANPKNYHKMWKYSRLNNEHNIFSIPFFIQFADVLFESLDTDEILQLDRNSFLNKICELWTENEFKTIWRLNSETYIEAYEANKVEYDQDISKAVYTQKLKDYSYELNDIVVNVIHHMVENDLLFVGIKEEDLKQIIDSEKYTFNHNTRYVRNFLVKNAFGRHIFMHSVLMEFFAGKYIVDADYQIKKSILNDNRFIDVKKFYVNSLLTSDKHDLDKIIDSFEYIVTDDIEVIVGKSEKCLLKLNEAHIKLKICDNVLVSEVVEMFPFIHSIQVNAFKLSKDDFDEYMLHQSLDFSDSNLMNLTGIHMFGSLKELDISNNVLNHNLNELAIDFSKVQSSSLFVEDTNIPLKYMELKQYETLSVSVNNIDELKKIVNGFRFEKVYLKLSLKLDLFLEMYNHFKDNDDLYVLSNVYAYNNFIDEIDDLDENEQLEIMEKIYLMQRVMNPIHKEQLWTANKYLTKLRLFDPEKTIRLCLDEYQMRVEKLGQNSEYALRTGHTLASAYDRAEQYDDAVKLGEFIYKKRLDLLGLESASTLVTGNNLALAYRHAKHYVKAIDLGRLIYDKRIEVLGEDSVETLTTGDCLATALYYNDLYHDSIELGKTIYKKRIEILGEDSNDTLSTGHKLALSMRLANQVNDSITLNETIYNKRMKILGEDSPITLTTGHNLAYALYCADRYEESIELGEYIYEKRIKVLGEDSEDTLSTGHNLALSMRLANQVNDSITLNETIYNKRMKTLGEDSPITLTTGHNLAYALYCADRYEESIELGKKVYEKRNEVLGEDSESTLLTGHNLALSMRLAEKVDESIELNRHIYNKRKGELGEESEATLKSGHNLAYALYCADNYEESIELGKHVYSKRIEVLGENSKETLLTGHNLALSMRFAKKFDDSIELNELIYNKRKEVLGEDSKATLKTGHNLALSLRMANKLEESIELYRVVYAKRKSVLGKDSKLTLLTGHNLAYALFCAKNYEEAIELGKYIHEQRKNIFGEDSNESLTTGHNLALALNESEIYENALETISDVYNLKKKVFGEISSSTIKSAKLLETILRHLERHDEADEIKNVLDRTDTA